MRKPAFVTIACAAILGCSQGTSTPSEAPPPETPEAAAPTPTDPAPEALAQATSAPVDPLALWSMVVPVFDPQTPTKQTGNAVEARWVLSGPDAACSDWSVQAAGGSLKGVEREPPAQPSDPEWATHFPVTLCTATLQESWDDVQLLHKGSPLKPARSVKGWGHVVSGLASGDPVVVLGDTGCRQDTAADCMPQPPNWGLPDVLTKADSVSPVLYLHAGDYRYTGEKPGTIDRWDFWHVEWFAPVLAGGRGAPWVLARGNHEECGTNAPQSPRNGQGWWWLLGATSTVQCPSSAEPLEVTWYVQLKVPSSTAGSFTKHRFVVVDTSSHYATQLAERFGDAFAAALPPGEGYTRWLHHHPILGFLNYQGHDVVDKGARERFAEAPGAGSPLCSPSGRCVPQADLASHQHFYEHVRFTKPGESTAVWPESVIIGNGGVNLVGSGLGPSPCTVSPTFAGTGGPYEATVQTTKGWGFVQAVLAADATTNDGWTMTPVFTAGLPVPGPGPGPTCHPSSWSVSQSSAALGFPN